MYIYNVTTNVDESVHEQWVHWMKNKHIPNMLATGKFFKAKMTQVLIEEELGGITYSVQYTAESREDLDNYYQENADELRNEAIKLFGDKIISFRTELKVLTEQYTAISKN